MKKRISILLFCVLIIAAMLTGCGSPAPAAETMEDITIALIAEGSPEELRNGAMEAAAGIGAELIDIADDDHEAARQIRDAVSAGYQAIVIRAEESDSVNAALEEAAAAGVKIVSADSDGISGADAVFTADNEAAGKTAGEAMLAELTKNGVTSGVIGILRPDIREKTVELRISGFRAAFADEAFTLMEMGHDENDALKAETAAGNAIANGVVGIFACCEDSSEAAGNAVKKAAARTLVVGFGQSDAVKGLVEDGFILTAMSRDYRAVGREAVKAAAALLRGETVEITEDTGITVLKADAADRRYGDYKIALIAGGKTDRSWEAMAEGAANAAERLGCQVVDMTAEVENSRQQAERIRDAVEDGCHAIVIAACDSDAVFDALKDASDAGVKIIIMGDPSGEPADGGVYADQKTAGRTAGETMLAALEAQEIMEGRICIIGIDEDDDVTAQREEGFRQAFAGMAYTLEEIRYSGGDAAMAHALAEEWLEEEVVGFFGCDEGSSVGCANAAGDEVIVVGCGENPRILELLEDETLWAAIAENPGAMGYEGVKTACVVLSGADLSGAATDTGVSVLTG